MRVIKNEANVFFDVDDTLILHNGPYESENAVYIKDPLDTSKEITVYAHTAMIRLLREEHHRGSHVVVWSRGGYEWAQAVIMALCLEPFVDMIMTKPMAYYDDLPIESWLTNRVYIEPGQKYK